MQVIRYDDAVEIAPGQRAKPALLEIRFDGCYPIVAGSKFTSRSTAVTFSPLSAMGNA